MVSDVAKVGGTQKCITDGVNQDVGIAMSVQAMCVGNAQSSQPECPTFHQSVHVVSESYSDIHSGCLSAVFAFANDFAQSVEVEGQRYAENLVERVAGACADNVTGIDSHDIHVETGTYSEET